jgi:hypothetical protein
MLSVTNSVVLPESWVCIQHFGIRREKIKIKFTGKTFELMN